MHVYDGTVSCCGGCLGICSTIPIPRRAADRTALFPRFYTETDPTDGSKFHTSPWEGVLDAPYRAPGELVSDSGFW